MQRGMSITHLAAAMGIMALTEERGRDTSDDEYLKQRQQKRIDAEKTRLDPIVEQIRKENAERRKANFDKQKKVRNPSFSLLINACDGNHPHYASTLEEFRTLVQSYAKGTYWTGPHSFQVDGIYYEVKGATLKECGVTYDDGFCLIS
jgi:hypothetical protein